MTSIQIEYFLALCERLSFSDTARDIHVSQPAISKQITAMENELGSALFERGYNRLALTRAGELYRDFFTKSLDGYNELRRYIAQQVENAHTRLKIGCISGIAVPPLAKAVKQYLDTYDDQEIHLQHKHFLTLYNSLEEGEIDILIALRPEIQNRPHLIWRTIDEDRPVLVLSRDNPLAGKPDLSIADLKEETFLALDPSLTPLSARFIQDLCQAHSFAPKRLEYMMSNESIRLRVESNMGVALMHRSMIYDTFADLIRFIPTDYRFYLVAAWKRNCENHYVELFIQELLRHYDGEGEG